MVPSSLWALSALLPLVSTANGLVFELSPNAHKRHAQHNRLAQKAKRATPVLPATWAYVNCYTDGPNRALPAAFVESGTMTVDYCVNYCNTNGYLYAGLEYSMECYCDNDIKNGNTVATDGRCNMMCNGDATQVCGGGYGLSVYKSSRGLPTALATYNNWGYQGCYTDNAGARTLTTAMAVTGSLTPQKCLDACHAANYLYAGMEYSGECYCGNGFSNGGALATDATTCDMTCAGDNTHICGGGNRLSLYKYGAAAVGGTTTTAATTTTTTSTTTQAPAATITTTTGGAAVQAATTTTTPSGPSTLQSYNGWNSLGCYVDSVASRSLPNGMATTGGAAGLTVERCLDACHAAGYTYAGVEYSAECYCGTTVPTQVATDGRCSMTCNGNPLEYCGGGNGLNVYKYGTVPTTTTTTTPATTSTTAPATTTTTTTAAATTTTTTPSGPSTLQSYNGWTSAGCYVDSVASRSLPVGMATTGGAAGLTVERCLDACHAAGYKYAGLEYSAECYCGTTMPTVAATDGRCTMTCNGNPLEYCGGGNGLTVYTFGTAPATTTTTTPAPTTTTTTPAPTSTTAPATTTTTTTTAAATTTTTPSGPSTLQAYNGWTSAGCYVDSVATRSLPIGMATVGGAAGLTVERCLDACHAAGYKFAGLEYSAECYCGTTMPTQVATDGRCSMTCNGNPLEYCGGGNGLTVYTFGTAPATTTTTTSTTPAASTPASTTPASTTPASTTPATTTTTTTTATPTQTGPIVVPSVGNWISQGCYIDSQAARTLNGATLNMNGANSIEACTTACYNAGYPYAGTEYAAECYCGTGIVNSGAPAGAADCNMPCNGNALEYCGGPNRLNIYKYNGTVPPPTNPVVNPGGGGGVTTPVTTGLPGTWSYKGCYVDNAFGRIMGYNLAPSNTNSAASCIAACQAAGFTLAGMEYADECYCSNSLANGATLAAAGNADCAMACTGDVNHACGGPNRISLYGSVANFNTYPVPTALKTNLPGSYTYSGCYAEPGAIRSFPYSVVNATANSVQQCLNLCSSYGYDAAGLEYGQECWCGDANSILTKGATAAPETNCNMPCPGSPADLCGGVNMFNLYTWPQSPTPLYVFNTPANTGHYELLIGGIVIPLIATLGLNNKVTFLEKYGTGAPNSTGAYELDYSLASDYTKAWRVMHVQSDVFCAANLVLPDRSGRILSVGGWSFESTEGVRLYTPSGSPGVNGTTDWEEHYDQIHLQKGRWYPGAMQMANGSIMIIGGEEGSNGAPVPSIEVLPKPAGGDTYLTMDWLLRTDPNNLYPFTFILPGGGIFVIYYNEARILDETTFATTKVLPLIPGAVNAAGGRTYPMEGTAMVMPQSWPYSDPIEILACGGSSFGQAFDNCVSIQPEVNGAEWVIERMPTRRVMTIMTALPDGTYFIAGGAQAGVAGFGLANTPNLSALLYDPSKPRNQRISILGNTIVPRLYHSEAILLHDGRILITGSDPEDQVNPQEYRMEVYVPPYRTDGSTPPTFTIQNRDWTHGGTYSFTLGVHQSNNIRVSLLGAVSTTHGNSFGQRTFFPKVTCSGNGCNVIAPPDVHTCPPGWYQMFVLDGPTPSYSQWVRIGGDPGNIGNWPNYPGFTLPGVGGI